MCIAKTAFLPRARSHCGTGRDEQRALPASVRASPRGCGSFLPVSRRRISAGIPVRLLKHTQAVSSRLSLFLSRTRPSAGPRWRVARKVDCICGLRRGRVKEGEDEVTTGRTGGSQEEPALGTGKDAGGRAHATMRNPRSSPRARSDPTRTTLFGPAGSTILTPAPWFPTPGRVRHS